MAEDKGPDFDLKSSGKPLKSFKQEGDMIQCICFKENLAAVWRVVQRRGRGCLGELSGPVREWRRGIA